MNTQNGLEPAAPIIAHARHHVVIIGAGFAGLQAIKALGRRKVDITVIDRTNHHLFQPLLYQVATAALNPADIASPIRRIVRGRSNVRVLMSEAREVDLERKHVVLDRGIMRYDSLIVAAGAGHSYFGNDQWQRFAPGLKSVEDALEIRSRILSAFELAEGETDEQRLRAQLTFVMIGAGPTGVELAGTMAEVARKTLARDFRHINPKLARIILVEGGPRVLPSYDEDLSESAKKQLEELGVEVRLNSLATDINDDGVWIGDQLIETGTVIWSAGVAGAPIAESLGVERDRAGRVKVEPTLTIPGHDDVFVVGDLMSLKSDGKPVPGVAPAAMQSGKHAGRNILRKLQNKPMLPFRYLDKGMLATIGRAAAIADIRGIKFTRLPAWLLWIFVHIVFLIGFKNRLLVLIQWAYSYLTYDRGARLITGKHFQTVDSQASSQNPDSVPEHSPAI